MREAVEVDIPASPFDGLVAPSRDYDAINAIANAPGVREGSLLSDGNADLSALDGQALFLQGRGGFIMFRQMSPQVYDFHTAFLPEHRGKNAYLCARAAAEFMFLRTDAMELHTVAPRPEARPPKTFGFQPFFTGPAGEYYRLHLLDWARKAPNLRAWGEWFHHALEAAKDQTGATVEAHDDDPANDRYAGLAAGMFRYGQPQKAVWAYNIWASTAGYHPVELISLDPVRVNTGDAIIRYQHNRLEFEQCL